MEKELLTPEECASLLGWSKVTVLKAARRGDLPCRRYNQRKILFIRREVLGWVDHKLPGRTLKEILEG